MLSIEYIRLSILILVTTDFPEWLRAQLDMKDMTPAELAARMKVARGTVSNILNGQRGVGKTMAKRIAKVLGLKEGVVLFHAGFIDHDPGDPTQRLSPVALEIVALVENKSEITQRAVLETIRALLASLDRGQGENNERDRATSARSK